MASILDKLRAVGPGVMVAAAFIGPGTVTTATIAGAGYGYTLLWAIVFSVVATLILQEMSARLGVISGLGVGEAIRQKVAHPLLMGAAAFLIISAIGIGNAAYEAGNITGAVLGFEHLASGHAYLVLIAVIGLLAFLLLYSGKYKLIERSLIALVSIMGVVFLACAILLGPDLRQILQGIFLPALPGKSLLMVIGLIGTTVVPYNLFLHASTVKNRWQGASHLGTSRWDTVLSVVLGGIITMAILITAAVAFEGQSREVNSAADLAMQLHPLLGRGSTLFIAFGFLAAGLSSAITAPLAAAFAITEILGRGQAMTSQLFRAVWILVLIAGVVFSSLGFRPTSVILFAQVANGLLLPIVAIFLLWIMNDAAIMGKHKNTSLSNILGGIVILITIGLGVKGILSAANLL